MENEAILKRLNNLERKVVVENCLQNREQDA